MEDVGNSEGQHKSQEQARLTAEAHRRAAGDAPAFGPSPSDVTHSAASVIRERSATTADAVVPHTGAPAPQKVKPQGDQEGLEGATLAGLGQAAGSG